MVCSVSRGSAPAVARARSCGDIAARNALPLAVQCSRNDSPTALTARSRCGATTWSTNVARARSSTDRLTVSLTSWDSSSSFGCRLASRPRRAVSASLLTSCPSRYRPRGPSDSTSPSSSRAFSRRWMVERARPTCSATSAWDSPAGARRSARRISAARAITWMPAWQASAVDLSIEGPPAASWSRGRSLAEQRRAAEPLLRPDWPSGRPPGRPGTGVSWPAAS